MPQKGTKKPKVWKVGVHPKRYKELIEYFGDKYIPKCEACKHTITKEDIRRNKWTVHHKDEDRNHNTPDNLELVHRSCHQKIHRNKEVRQQYYSGQPQKQYIYKSIKLGDKPDDTGTDRSS
jgi:hypothetical protein